MNEDVFLLLVGWDENNPDVIYSRHSNLRINVYCLNHNNHQPQTNEIQLFSYFDSTLLMFETVDILADDALDMISAIRWYARYINFPEMEILPDDPRIDQEIAV
jgi:hypothetical protein